MTPVRLLELLFNDVLVDMLMYCWCVDVCVGYDCSFPYLMSQTRVVELMAVGNE